MLKNKIPYFEDINKINANLDKEKKSKNIITKYELNQIIGLRTTQIANGAITFVDTTNLNIKSNMELRKVAIKELLEGKLPFAIQRPLPNNKSETIRLKDLDFVAVQHLIR